MTKALPTPISKPDHIPVLIHEVLDICDPQVGKVIVDATFGAGGYTKTFLEAGAHVIALDRDPTAIAAGHKAFTYDTLTLCQTRFSEMDTHVKTPVDAVVMDIGVSSMQLDQGQRGFSFQQDAPLDMRMSAEGASAADLVNTLEEDLLANIFYHFGDERSSRRIAKRIIETRKDSPIKTTLELVEVVKRCLPFQKPGQIHPATRVFQALRIAVNDELGELFRGLCAAERLLKPGGVLAVVTFHSIEDRIVKRFFQLRSKGFLSSKGGNASRYSHSGMDPSRHLSEPQRTLTLLNKRPVTATKAETDQNARARSAKLRAAQKLEVHIEKPLEGDALDSLALILANSLNIQE